MSASAQGLIDFIAASPTPYHCVQEAVRRLTRAGWVEQDEALPFEAAPPGDRRFVRRGGTLVAWLAGTGAPAEAGFRVLGAHTDSPNFRIKPTPEYVSEGYVQWGIEVYGGVLLHTWLDRDLGISGRVSLRQGDGVQTRLVRVERPIARIPNLAIHLLQELLDNGFNPNKQKHLPPMVGLEGGLSDGPTALYRLLSAELDVDPKDILGHDLMLHDLQPPTLGGLNQEFVFAPRLDNQGCSYVALEALIAQQEPAASTSVIALYDHEECGSLSSVGADSSFLEMLLERMEAAHPAKASGGISRSACSSLMVSADMAHAVHPNYADRHDDNHKPRMNAGPVIKYNANNRYATTGVTAAWFAAACEAEGVAYQTFITRTDLRCGTTIGPMASARLGFPTVDIGYPMLSMHSVREQCGAHDVAPTARALGRILGGPKR
ncbi:MAG: M18 family aminopeptidase [Alphaproteobacteria bacterium]|nr:M18 family aminopeptidase [Alphaproteobacteria bacterium]